MIGVKGRVALAALMAVVAGAPAAADHLVTSRGQVIETRGGWEVRGELVVFDLPDGTLASLRLEEVDVEASERWNSDAARRALRAREESLRPPPEPVQATVVITDRDVTRTRNLGEPPALEGSDALTVDGEEADAGSSAGELDGGVQDGGVQVVEWSQEPAGDTGLEVRGVVQNLSSSFTTGVSVDTLFYDETGVLVAAREVRLEDGPLGPGARREFSVSIPDTVIYDEIKFLVVGRGFRSVAQSVRADGPPPELPEVP